MTLQEQLAILERSLKQHRDLALDKHDIINPGEYRALFNEYKRIAKLLGIKLVRPGDVE